MNELSIRARNNGRSVPLIYSSGLRGGGSGFVKLGFRVIGVELNGEVNDTGCRELHHYIEEPCHVDL